MGAPEDGPSTGARGQDLRQGQVAETYAEQRARANAMRGEATDGRGSGATRREQQDPSVRGAERAGGAVDPSVLAAFTQDLLAGSEVGEMDGGVDVGEEMEDLEIEPEGPDQERRVKKARSARGSRRSTGGVDDSGDDEPVDEAAAPAPVARSAKWPRVSAKKRIRALDLTALLAAGAESRVLVGWQAETVRGLVLGLPSRGFHLLWRAHDSLPGPAHRVVLLQALAAHRRDDDLTRLAARLADVSEEELHAWIGERIGARDPDQRDQPGEAPDLAVLMSHYDPCAHWLHEPPPSLQCEEQWAVPQWLRGARREAIELCAVAFLQAGLGTFVTGADDEEESGANDPLAAAIEVHGESHPALARWGVTLLARADTRAGLDCAADALLRARAGLPS